MDISTAIEFIEYDISGQLAGTLQAVPVLQGTPGIGKTTLLKKLTDRLGYHLYCLSLGSKALEYYSGIPDIIHENGNRFKFYDVTFSMEKWINEFGYTLNYSVLSFLRANPNFAIEDERTDRPFATPRVWTEMANYINGVPENKLRNRKIEIDQSMSAPEEIIMGISLRVAQNEEDVKYLFQQAKKYVSSAPNFVQSLGLEAQAMAKNQNPFARQFFRIFVKDKALKDLLSSIFL